MGLDPEAKGASQRFFTLNPKTLNPKNNNKREKNPASEIKTVPPPYISRIGGDQIVHDQGRCLGWIIWFNPVGFLGDPVEMCSLSWGRACVRSVTYVTLRTLNKP